MQSWLAEPSDIRKLYRTHLICVGDQRFHQASVLPLLLGIRQRSTKQPEVLVQQELQTWKDKLDAPRVIDSQPAKPMTTPLQAAGPGPLHGSLQHPICR